MKLRAWTEQYNRVLPVLDGIAVKPGDVVVVAVVKDWDEAADAMRFIEHNERTTRGKR